MSVEADEDDVDVIYRVVINHEEQYSIWPADRDTPPGWRDEGTQGTKAQCLSHVDKVWTDMRPLSLRQFMADALARAEAGEDPPGGTVDDLDDDTPSLVSRLSTGSHPVEISLRPQRTAPALRDAIDRGYVFVRFTGTRGGTELGVHLDPAGTDLSGADFDQASGVVHLAGDLTLDFEPVRCSAEIDLTTMAGSGRLTPVARD